MDFLGQIDAELYLSVNVGSGSPREQQDWLNYLTAPADTGPGRERAQNGHEKPWNVPYIGVGNESWGCGGNMRADHYADEFRLFSAYLRTRSGDKAQLIASGADTDDYSWTETVMARAMTWRPDPAPLMLTDQKPLTNGVSLHFYTFASNDWSHKGRAIRFSEGEWMSTLQRAETMDELIQKHTAIMDHYDPEKKVALVVDEWGTWFEKEPNSPSALFEQNTFRDAMVAGVTLNIFHHHADRVRMANIAQMVNVLQAMIVTDKDRMLLTPTYHVFDMYKVHQNAISLPVTVTSPDYRFGNSTLPALSLSASRDKMGLIHLSIVNIDPHASIDMSIALPGQTVRAVSGQVLTAPQMDSFNSFETPHVIEPAPFRKIQASKQTLRLTVPAMSILVLEVK